MDSDSALKVGRHLVIPPAELEWRFSASGGPGGQHANTANTRGLFTPSARNPTCFGGSVSRRR